jgi:hypothetical protein
LAELVERLTERLAEQTGLTAMWQERAGTLADRLAVAESKLLALEAPKTSLAASMAEQPPDPSPRSHPHHLTHSQRHYRPRRTPRPGGGAG